MRRMLVASLACGLAELLLAGCGLGDVVVPDAPVPGTTLPANSPAPVYALDANPPTAAAFALGRSLFYDVGLSRDGSVSCGSCHQQFVAFANVGGGLKLPTGEYTRQNAQGQRYPLLNQVGTGTTDGSVYANYIGSFRSFGLSVNSSYRRATENPFRNSLAPSTATYASLFYRVPLGENWQVYPSAQFFYEKTKGEMLEGNLTGEHAMNNALLGPGLDVYYKNFSLNTSFQLPIYTATTDHPASAGRFVVSVGYCFKQTNDLLHGKS